MASNFVFLHVAEKPSVARSIAEALLPAESGGRLPPSSGRPGATPVFTFESPTTRYGLVRHIVTSVKGHLASTDFAPPYKCVTIEWKVPCYTTCTS